MLLQRVEPHHGPSDPLWGWRFWEFPRRKGDGVETVLRRGSSMPRWAAECEVHLRSTCDSTPDWYDPWFHEREASCDGRRRCTGSRQDIWARHKQEMWARDAQPDVKVSGTIED